MGVTDEHVEKWVSLQSPAITGAPTPEQQAAMGKLAAEKKAWLKALATEQGTSEKKLTKELTKLASKAAKAAAPPKPKKEKIKQEVKKEEPEEEARPDEKLPTPQNNIGYHAKASVGEKAALEQDPGYWKNSPEVLAKHLKDTGGKWQTRFPPEPNGYLHIGHAKAMYFNFGTAANRGGECYMRFDDTNPEAEEKEYIDMILENVQWLGHKWKTDTVTGGPTYSSDYFQELYDMAVELIKRGKAFVCHQTQPEIKASREMLQEMFKVAKETKSDPVLPPGAASPWRDRSVEENLMLFDQMRCGMWDEGTATLRMKMDLMSPNPNMWDHAAYRIMFSAHPHAKDKWCIYPTYDYTHCLVDSIENITHSMCTLEFETRQSKDGSYHWLVDALGLYHSYTWEYSRCSISHNVLSKRRLNILATQGYVSGWDDPRLLTLEGLRRRGYTPTAINTFCKGLGVARSSNTVCVSKNVLENCIRNELDVTAHRCFACLKPIKVTIANHKSVPACNIPNHPANKDFGTRTMEFTPVLYIDSSDFRETASKEYFGLTPGSTVRLLHGYDITCKEIKKSNGIVTELVCEFDINSLKEKPRKGKIGWVSGAAVPCTVNLYSQLFNQCDIETTDESGKKTIKEVSAEEAASTLSKKLGRKVDYIELFNPNSLEICTGALIEPHAAKQPPLTHYQFTRMGYFVVDKVSTETSPVFNLVCALKEAKGK